MSGSYQDHSSNNVVSIGASEAEAISDNLRSLRDQIITAWQERGVLLSREEQDQLHVQIQQTCELLIDLTRHP